MSKTLCSTNQAIKQITRSLQRNGKIGTPVQPLVEVLLPNRVPNTNELRYIKDAVQKIASKGNVRITYKSDSPDIIESIESIEQPINTADMPDPLRKLTLVEVADEIHRYLLSISDSDGYFTIKSYEDFKPFFVKRLESQGCTTDGLAVHNAFQFLYRLGLRESIGGRRIRARVRPIALTPQMINCAKLMRKTPGFTITDDEACPLPTISDRARDALHNQHIVDQQQAQIAELEAQLREMHRLTEENAGLLEENERLTREHTQMAQRNHHLETALRGVVQCIASVPNQ